MTFISIGNSWLMQYNHRVLCKIENNLYFLEYFKQRELINKNNRVTVYKWVLINCMLKIKRCGVIVSLIQEMCGFLN